MSETFSEMDSGLLEQLKDFVSRFDPDINRVKPKELPEYVTSRIESHNIITLIGPSGVGKTSLLSTMYVNYTKDPDASRRFRFHPAPATRDELWPKAEELRRAQDMSMFTPVPGFIKGTQGLLPYKFTISSTVLSKDKTNEIKEFDAIFVDHKGGIIDQRSKDPEIRAYQFILARSSVIINVIDGAVLMVDDGDLDDQYNGHQTVNYLLSEILRQDQRDRLIMFVITKCEKWLANEEDAKRLQARFEKKHRAVLNTIDTYSNVVGVYMPVKTTGCLEFKNVDEEGRYVYMRVQREFKPEFVQEPLRYALAFDLKVRELGRTPWEQLKRWWIGSSTLQFKGALTDFYEARHRTQEPYGNKELLARITK